MKRNFNKEVWVGNIQFESCSTSLVIRELQVKNMKRFYYTLIKTVTINNELHIMSYIVKH